MNRIRNRNDRECFQIQFCKFPFSASATFLLIITLDSSGWILMVESPTPTMVACVVVLGETPNTSSHRPASPDTNAKGT